MQAFFGVVKLCFTESVLSVHLDDDLHSLVPLSSWTTVGKTNGQNFKTQTNTKLKVVLVYRAFYVFIYLVNQY